MTAIHPLQWQNVRLLTCNSINRLYLFDCDLCNKIYFMFIIREALYINRVTQPISNNYFSWYQSPTTLRRWKIVCSAVIFHLFTLRNRFTVKVTEKGERETCAIADLSCYILTIAQSCQLRIAKLFIIANFKVAICFAVVGINCRLINCNLRSEQIFFFVESVERQNCHWQASAAAKYVDLYVLC